MDESIFYYDSKIYWVQYITKKIDDIPCMKNKDRAERKDDIFG